MESAAAVQLSKDQEKNLIALIKEREVLWEDTVMARFWSYHSATKHDNSTHECK